MPGGNTPQDTNYTATCLPSRKLSKLDEPDTQDTAGEARTKLSVMYSYGPPHIAKQKQDDQLEHTYIYMRIRDVAPKTYQKRWMMGRSGERGSGISVLAARHDDDDDDEKYLKEILGAPKHWLVNKYKNTDTKSLFLRKKWYFFSVCKSVDFPYIYIYIGLNLNYR